MAQMTKDVTAKCVRVSSNPLETLLRFFWNWWQIISNFPLDLVLCHVFTVTLISMGLKFQIEIEIFWNWKNLLYLKLHFFVRFCLAWCVKWNISGEFSGIICTHNSNDSGSNFGPIYFKFHGGHTQPRLRLRGRHKVVEAFNYWCLCITLFARNTGQSCAARCNSCEV